MVNSAHVLSPFDTSRVNVIKCPVIFVDGTTQDDTIVMFHTMKSS